jgi:hypothetical protein
MQGSMALSIAALQGWFFFIPRMFFFLSSEAPFQCDHQLCAVYRAENMQL